MKRTGGRNRDRHHLLQVGNREKFAVVVKIAFRCRVKSSFPRSAIATLIPAVGEFCIHVGDEISSGGRSRFTV